MRIVSASFFWKNNEPDGLGITFGPPGFSPEELAELFTGETARQYMRDSDANLGTQLVDTYLAQLAGIAQEAKGRPVSLEKALIAALNIIYLADRGFIPNDQFNGPMFVQLD